MATKLITLFTYIFDFFILYIYTQNILKERKKNIPNFVFFFSYICVEIILYINELLSGNLSNQTSLIVNSIVSLITTFLICFLFKSTILEKIFCCISFQVLATFAEYCFVGIIGKINPEIFDYFLSELNIIMNLGSKIFLFFFSIIIGKIFSQKIKNTKYSYTLLIFATPIITIVIMLFTPVKEINQGMNRTFFTCLYICLALLNIINYILININYNQTALQFQLEHSETLIKFQQEKYRQLSSAYKANRSLIHDVKKHYFSIENYIKNKEYEKLESYLNISISNLEKTYSEINTGNLVIDSYITNYKNLCEENNINFITDLSVDCNRIPLNDYDLCIILGNILENALNACLNNTTEQNHIKVTIINSEKDIFYIRIENTYNNNYRKNYIGNDFENDYIISKHGYGIPNIKDVVERNRGVLNVSSDTSFIINIVVPITDINKRITPPSIYSTLE